MSQGKANLLLTTPLTPDDEAAEHIRRHGDGVRDIAFEVDDADQAFAEAVRRGAKPVAEPHDEVDEHGAIRRAAVHTYGDTIHSLISYKGYDGPFMPGFMAAPIAADDCGILRIDHIVGNVEEGKMQYWADYYANVFGFHRYITFDDKDISTEYSALMSIVMSDDSHSVQFPINEPAPGRKRSQIAGISILLVRRRKNTPLSARLATFFAFVPTAKPPSCPAGPLPRPKSRDLPDFEAISQTPLPQLPSVVQIGFAWLARLSGRQRQSQNPPQHACEQAPRQVALGQHHPVVPSVLD
jgi:hypothetical protein